MILSEQLPDDVILLGTDFNQQTVIDKKVDFIFCNPPYSEYDEWAEKIILQGNCNAIALVIPARWAGNGFATLQSLYDGRRCAMFVKLMVSH